MRSDQISPPRLLKEYTDFSQDIDLVAASPEKDSAAVFIRVITVGATPALAVTTVAAGSGPLTPIAGETIPGRFRKILASGTSDVTRVRVGWA